MDTSVSLATPSNIKHAWAHTEIKKLIELIKTNECLWKVNSLGYNGRIAKSEALKEISTKINIPIEDVKEKIKKLRIQLLREIKLLKIHQLNMPTIEYYSKWNYFESLQFMIDDVTTETRSRISLSTNTGISGSNLNDTSTDNDVSSSENQFKKPCICQLCFTMVNEDTFFITLSTQINPRETINDIVLKYFNFVQEPNITESDSKNICIICWQHIKQFHKYSTKIRMVQDSFRNLNENVHTSLINIEGDQIKNEKISNICDNIESSALVQSKKDQFSFVNDNDEDTTFEYEKYEANSNSNSSEVEVGYKDKFQPTLKKSMSMPRNFDQQILTDGIYKRLGQIRPVLTTDSKTFTCNFCGKSYKQNSSAYSHVQVNHPLPYLCPDGDERFNNFKEVIKHIKTKHQIQNGSESQICPICGKMLNSKFSLSLHIETVHRPNDQPRVQCKKCGTWLRDTHILKIHMRKQHLVEKVAVKCDQCSVTLSSLDRLEIHRRRYHENYMKTHKCSICEKVFHAKQRLKEHIGSIHGGGEPMYKCEFCPKTFNVRSNSYTHRRRMHPKEYQEIIDKREAEKVICNTNQADVNDQIADAFISYKCKLCPEEFKFKKYLRKHTLSVHKNKNTKTAAKSVCN